MRVAQDPVRPLSPGEPDPPAGSFIRKTPGVCGGEACVRNMRIPVWLLIEWMRLGQPDAEILLDYPALSAQDLAAVRAYAEMYPEEIEEAIRANDEP
jgi:uncharacterized protein (DUF433 family)